MNQAEPKNQVFLWHLPECCLLQIWTASTASVLFIWLKIKSIIELNMPELTRLIQITLQTKFLFEKSTTQKTSASFY